MSKIFDLLLPDAIPRAVRERLHGCAIVVFER